MKNSVLSRAGAAALAVAFTVSLPQPAHAGQSHTATRARQHQVHAGNKAFLVGHAVGTQNYVCLPSGSWLQVRALHAGGHPVQRHRTSKSSPTSSAPTRRRTTRFAPHGSTPATRASSGAKATDSIDHSSDPDFVAQGAIAWLLLRRRLERQDGPTGGDTLTKTTFVQRLNTSGGVAPATGCASLSGRRQSGVHALQADYFFYTAPNSDDDDRY